MIKVNSEKVLFIDAHCHVFDQVHGIRLGDTPTLSADYGRVKVGDKLDQIMAPSYVNTSSPIEVLEIEFLRSGVDKAVLPAGPAFGPQYKLHDEIIKKNPGKYVTCGLACPTRGKEQFLREATESLIDHNYPALKFEMPDTPFVVDAKENAYIFEFLLAHDKFVMIDLGWGPLEYAENNPFNYPIEMIKNVVKRYKDLKFIFPHLGISQLWDENEYINFDILKNTLSLLDLNDNVWFDMSGLNFVSHKFDEYPYPKAKSALKVVKDTVGMDHIMWGTDYPSNTPYCTYQQCVDYVFKHCEFLTEQDKINLAGAVADKVWFSN